MATLAFFLSGFGFKCQGEKRFMFPAETNQSEQNQKSLQNTVFPLKISSSDIHHLVDQTGTPFFWSGDAAWSIIAQLNKEDVVFYLDNRKQKGFSVILANLIENKYGSNAPANIYGDPPFTGEPFISASEEYFVHADFVIQEAQKRNILVLLNPLYLGYKDEGWIQEMKAASESDIHAWGRFVGNRYKKFDNIMWVIGGDTDPTPVKDKVLQMVKGIMETDTLHLMTAHNHAGTMATAYWENDLWLTVNNVYSYDSTIYRHYKTAYQLSPAMPYFMIESGYENEHKRNSTPVQLRSQSYQAVLGGAMGYIFGNCPIWHFGSTSIYCGGLTDWKPELDNQGSRGIDYLQRLFRSRDWVRLAPDFEHRFLVDGYGEWGSTNYVTAAITMDKSTLIAYLPISQPVTIDLSSMAGNSSKCWWYNPSTADAKLIGTFNNTGLKTFTPPDGDWVLVVDNVELHLPPPGKI